MARNKEADRYIGKIKTTEGKYGPQSTIYINNPDTHNADGTPNQYCKGILIWVDQATGAQVQVRQLGISVPKDGMSQRDADVGFSCNVTINLEDTYQTKKLD